MTTCVIETLYLANLWEEFSFKLKLHFEIIFDSHPDLSQMCLLVTDSLWLSEWNRIIQLLTPIFNCLYELLTAVILGMIVLNMLVAWCDKNYLQMCLGN